MENSINLQLLQPSAGGGIGVVLFTGPRWSSGTLTAHEVFCVNRFYVQVTFGLKLGILDTTMIALKAIVDYNYRKITKCSAENLILQTNH